MKKLYYLPLLLVGLFMAACSNNQKKADGASSIDLAKAMEELTELKVSDFGQSVQYIPLETTDESLIGNNPDIIVLKDKIITITGKQCMVFDKKSGKFITQVGHIGNDPEGYSSTSCWVDEENDMLYFHRQPNQLMGYDTKGNYKGKIEIQGKRMPSYFEFSGETIIGAYNNDMEQGENSIAIFSRNGEMMDSIPALLTPSTLAMSDIVSISVIKDINKFGNWAKAGVIIIDYAGDKKLMTAPGSEVLWTNNNEVRYKEMFNDTIYTVTNSKLEPYITFATGSWHWPEDERTNPANNNKRLVVNYVKETDNKIFFQCVQGLYADAVVFDGIFDKKTGRVKLGKSSDKIEDDINSFLPIQVLTISSADEYAGFIEAPDALEWLEDNPDAASKTELAFLNNLTDDMNPIVVLVK